MYQLCQLSPFTIHTHTHTHTWCRAVFEKNQRTTRQRETTDMLHYAAIIENEKKTFEERSL